MRHSQKLKELERRRRRGARLLAAGESQAEVARRVGVSRQTVMRWERARQEGGMEALRRAPHFGRPERLSAAQRQELVRLLKEGALAAGFPNGVMDSAADRAADRDEVLREDWSPPRSGGCSDGSVGACSGRRARRANATSERFARGRPRGGQN